MIKVSVQYLTSNSVSRYVFEIYRSFVSPNLQNHIHCIWNSVFVVKCCYDLKLLRKILYLYKKDAKGLLFGFIMLCLIRISQNIYTTRSPISVLSPALSIARSGRSAHAWMTRLYFFSTYLLPNRMLSLTVRFCIHASWGTYATEPWI